MAVPVAPADSVTVVGVIVGVRPEGDPLVESDTGPEKLFKLDSVIVEVAELPAVKLTVEGLLEMPKSGVAVVVLKNSVMGEALASPVDNVARPQFVSTVFGNE